MGDIVNLDDVIRKEMERNNVTKPGEMVLNPVNREEPSNSLMTVATAMRTAADDKYPYGKPQTDEVARGSGNREYGCRRLREKLPNFSGVSFF